MLLSMRKSIRSTSLCARCFASAATPGKAVELAYKLHASPTPSSNSPLIIMHGLFGSKSNWQSLSKGFARDLDRSVYALDARNHGDSPHVPEHNYAAMAEDVRKFILDHNLQDPIVIGHSMGAKTAMTLALKYPALVKLLVSVDNAPVDAALHSDFPKYVRTMKEIETAGVSKQSEADAMLKEVEEDVAIRQFLLTNLKKNPETKTFGWRVALPTLTKSLDMMGDFDLLPEKYRFKKPTLFIRGTFSKYVTDEMIPLIGRFFPRFQIKDIDAGHWVQAEQPAEFRDVLTRFIRDEEENISEQRSTQAPWSSSSRPVQARHFSTSALRRYDHKPASLTDQEYFKLADSTLNHLLEQLEEQADINPDIDVEYSEGVMNVSLPIGTYVINRQPPSKQIWLSSPLSGPKRFDYITDVGWTYKDGTRLKELLETEWTKNGLEIELTRLGLT